MIYISNDAYLCTFGFAYCLHIVCILLSFVFRYVIFFVWIFIHISTYYAYVLLAQLCIFLACLYCILKHIICILFAYINLHINSWGSLCIFKANNAKNVHIKCIFIFMFEKCIFLHIWSACSCKVKQIRGMIGHILDILLILHSCHSGTLHSNYCFVMKKT